MQNIVNHILLIFASIGFLWSLYYRYSARSAKKWTPTKANVCHTSIDHYIDEDNVDIYTAKIEYEYKWHDEKYKNDQISKRMMCYFYPDSCLISDDDILFHRFKRQGKYVYYRDHRKVRIQSLIERFEEGTELRVFVDPMNPHKSIIEPGSDFISYVISGFFFVGMLICIGHIYLY